MTNFRLFQVILEVRIFLTDLLNGNIRFSYSHELIISATGKLHFHNNNNKNTKVEQKKLTKHR